MKLAIMQPYFLPYIGYFQLIAAVDLFIVYDNIKYIKKGWINRNRMLLNGSDATFSLPLKKDSDSRDLFERQLSAGFDRQKLLNQIVGAYRRAPYFEQTFPLLERIVWNQDDNLFRYIYGSIASICNHLGISTELRISSQIDIDHGLKKNARVLALCNVVGASTYINPIGGTELYSRDEFKQHGIELKFLRAKPFEYPQFGDGFVPWLSLLDVMMFNSRERIDSLIRHHYELM